MIPNPAIAVQGLDGAAVVLIICGLLFIEECGLPLPFVPGDLLLLLGGIAIADHRVEALPLAAASCAAVIAGALVAHTLFGLIGREPLRKLAQLLHLGKALERATRIVDAGGWRGVLAGRLIPGLRVHTSEVAGMLRMRRRDFLAGLVPSALLYVAVFTSAGALFGSAALSAIQASEHWLVVFAAGALLIGAALLSARHFKGGQTTCVSVQ